MKTHLQIGGLILLLSILLFPQTSIPPGDVSGIWVKAGNPYLINGDINIQNNNTLTIEPGVIVQFQGNYKLNVFGRLLAIGVINDTIYFSVQDTSVGWHGIRIINSNSNAMDSSKIVLCKFTSGKALNSTTADKRGGAIYCEQSSDVLIKNCAFMKNYAAFDGGAIALINNSAILIDSCIFMNNDCAFYGGCIYVDGSNAKIKNSIFSNNRASFFGAAIAGWNSSAFRVENCKISDNVAGACTGIYTAVNCSPTIVNTLFSGNISTLGNGGGCGFSVSTPTLINVTVVNNSVAQGGAGMWIYNSTATIKNSIVYNNSPDQLSVTGTANVTYSNIMGGYTGTGNINQNPQFIGTGTNQFALQDSSPCRNSGTPDTIGLNLPLFDLAGNNRISDNRIDIGAYEVEEIVPVELISFDAIIIEQSVQLKWTTASELNNQGFEVERLQDSKIEKLKDWVKIGFENGNGTTTEPQAYSFIDRNISPGKYQYRLKQIDFGGSFEYSNIIEVDISLPEKFSLEQNYPNPFNPSTKIKFTIPSVTLSGVEGSFVTLKVFDVLGNEIATLVNEEKPAGRYEVEFKSTVSSLQLASGVYYYQLRAGDYLETKKMIFLK